jgi:hypothetical protein
MIIDNENGSIKWKDSKWLDYESYYEIETMIYV